MGNGESVMEFLSRVFGDSVGYLCLVTIKTGGRRTDHYYDYPNECDRIDKEIARWASTDNTNVYFSPVLYKEPDADSEIVCQPVLAADLDMVQPILVDPLPDIVVESSPGRFQVYWYDANVRPESVNGDVIGNVEIKRLPKTKNWKYNRSDPWTVAERNVKGLRSYSKVIRQLGLTGSSFDYLFANGDRWSLARLCARLGVDSIGTFLVLQAAQRQAGTLRGSDGYITLATLYKDAIEAVAAGRVPSLLTEDEIRRPRLGGGSFVDQYVEWATKCTDAPKQYHIAGALMILSSLLAPYVRLPMAHSALKCNLWFMILGQTTLTRKTTAMEMAVAMAKSVNRDVVMSTDGNSEGILSALGDRNGQSSLFHRDELSGLLAEAGDKKYMSGFLERLTRLYDGCSERRTLSRRVIEVNDPYFMMMCGGIKNKVIELMTEDFINSGFLLRFLIVCGWTRPEDIREMGPPVFGTEDTRGSLVDYLIGLHSKFSPRGRLARATGVISNGDIVNAKVTDAAWARIRQLDADGRERGLNSEFADTFAPLYDRMVKSIIKVSVLLAADRAYREEHELILDEQDLVAAIEYSDVWAESIHEVVSGIYQKPSKEEARILRISTAIRGAKPDGIMHSLLMQRFGLRSTETKEIIATLKDRGLITECQVNRATVYRARE